MGSIRCHRRPMLRLAFWRRWRGAVTACALAWLVVACGSPGRVSSTEFGVTLPLRMAWFEGRIVEYVTTDVSDADMARMMGVNHVPMLALAAAPAGSPPGTRTAVDRVYVFPGEEQINVFASAPVPAGPSNASPAYTPLWRAVMVRWAVGRRPRMLNSEEVVLDAVDKGDVQLTQTSIIVNCPVVRSADGAALRGLR